MAMKIKGFFINERKYVLRKITIMFFIFVGGIILGSLYCTLLGKKSDSDIYTYLMQYFASVKENLDRITVFKNAVSDYIRLFLIAFVFAYIKIGFVVIDTVCALKGFVLGFTFASFVKYYGTKGLLFALINIPQNILFIPVFLYFCAESSIFAVNKLKYDKINFKRYIILSICCLAIFCAISFFEAVVTTTFMKLISSVFA